MGTEALLKEYAELQRQLNTYNYAMGILQFDGETAAPPASDYGRGEVLSSLSMIRYDLFINDRVKDLLDALWEKQAELSPEHRRSVELSRRQYNRTTCVPKEEFAAFMKLKNKAESVWREARKKNDFPAFLPELEQLIVCVKRFALYERPNADPYDTMLDLYEEGLTRDYLDGCFDNLRKVIVPLVRALPAQGGADVPVLRGHFPQDKQKQLALAVMDYMAVDPLRCALSVSAHPFTISYTKWDTRITTRYDEGDVFSSLFSAIHEAGHGLYEMGIDDKHQGTPLAAGASDGIHESQSRLYENMLGRSLPFTEWLLPHLRDYFPDVFRGVTPQALYRALNRARPSLIRVEADELTYSLHIMVRYELEKALMDGSLKAGDLPGEWNRRCKDYLGLDVPDDAHGVLQDVHWSSGSFGYFPSYSIGSAYAAQIFDAMQKQVDVDAAMRSGSLKDINAWLGEKLHRHGMLYPPAELLKRATGSAFDMSHYTGYLKSKYRGLYNL